MKHFDDLMPQDEKSLKIMRLVNVTKQFTSLHQTNWCTHIYIYMQYA